MLEDRRRARRVAVAGLDADRDRAVGAGSVITEVASVERVSSKAPPTVRQPEQSLMTYVRLSAPSGLVRMGTFTTTDAWFAGRTAVLRPVVVCEAPGFTSLASTT